MKLLCVAVSIVLCDIAFAGCVHRSPIVDSVAAQTNLVYPTQIESQDLSISNDGIRWGYKEAWGLYRSPAVIGEEERRLMQAEDPPSVETLLDCLTDTNKWKAAHVLITYRYWGEYSATFDVWNELNPDCSDNDADEMSKTQAFWAKKKSTGGLSEVISPLPPDQLNEVFGIQEPGQSVAELHAQREREETEWAEYLYQKTSELKKFKGLFEMRDAKSLTNSATYGLYFYDHKNGVTPAISSDVNLFGIYYQWEAYFKPKRQLAVSCEAGLTFPVLKSNDTVLVGLTPERVMECLEEICDTPFVRHMAETNSNALIVFDAAGDRLHFNSEDVGEYQQILEDNGIEPGPFKNWMRFYLYPEGRGGAWVLLHHPAGTDVFLVTFNVEEVESWRKQCQEIDPYFITYGGTFHEGKCWSIGPPYALLNGDGEMLGLLGKGNSK